MMNVDAELVRAALAAASTPAELPLHPGMQAAAVLVPIRFDASPVVFALLRAEGMREHAGEVGFPGGKRDLGDQDLRATALREGEEEIGVGAHEVDILGELSPVPVVGGRYRIHPFVAACRGVPRVASAESVRLFEIPIIPYLSGERRYGVVEATWRGVGLRVPHFNLLGPSTDHGPHERGQPVLYGASAYVLYELLEKIAARLGDRLPEGVLTTTFPWGDRYKR